MSVEAADGAGTVREESNRRPRERASESAPSQSDARLVLPHGALAEGLSTGSIVPGRLTASSWLVTVRHLHPP